MKALPLFCLLTALTCSCASTMAVTDITDKKSGDEIGGIPFRIPETYHLHVYMRNSSGDLVLVHEERRVLAGQDRVYAMSMDNQFLSDHDLKLTINADGTLTKADLSTTIQADEILGSLEDGIKALDTALTSETEAEQELMLAAITAKGEVDVSQAKLDALPPDAALSEVAQAENDLLQAKAKSNFAYQAIGLPEPYPGVFP